MHKSFKISIKLLWNNLDIVFIACGINHQTAPIAIREQLALTPQQQKHCLQHCLNFSEIQEALILTTCNRTELYCEISSTENILTYFAQIYQINQTLIKDYFYIYTETAAISHILRVANGLNSMMLGETQIFGQLKQAYQIAVQTGALKHKLQPIFQYIFSISKQIRTKSGLGKYPISIAFAAVQLIERSFPLHTALTILIIGSGETATLVSRYLHEQKRHKFMVASRTQLNADNLADTINGKAILIHELALHLSEADVIISATACPLPFISKALVAQAIAARQNAPMLFIDLAVPRDIEANVNTLDNVILYNIDDLHQHTLNNIQERRIAADAAENLITHAMEQFVNWQRVREATQLICDYRQHMHTLAAKEVQRAIQQLSTQQCPYVVIKELSDRLVNKLTHDPTIGLRKAAFDGRHDILDLAQYLFHRKRARHEKID